jgi:hypothetical protein
LSVLTFVILGFVNPLTCNYLCSTRFPNEVYSPVFVFVVLVGGAAVSSGSLWFWLRSRKIYRAFNLPEKIDRSDVRANVKWAIGIPALIISVIPILAAITFLFSVGFIDIFPAEYLMVFSVFPGFFVLWSLMSSKQEREALEVYQGNLFKAVTLAALISCVAVMLFLVRNLLLGWQTLLHLQLFLSPLAGLQLIFSFPILNIPDANSLVVISSFIFALYVFSGLLFYSTLFERLPPEEKSGYVIILPPAGDKREKWKELRSTFSKLQGPVIASLPFLDSSSAEVIGEIKTNEEIKIITGKLWDEDLKNKLEKLNNKGYQVNLLELYYTTKEEKQKPLIHDRYVLSNNLFIVLGTDIKFESLVRESLIFRFPQNQIVNTDTIRERLNEYWNSTSEELSVYYHRPVSKNVAVEPNLE